ncbi:hypothetical protein LK527_09330 [[Clostridium] innocuum]|uniref:hypothetical protein n=1 Tax=Clostridium innocuum TaxID=1522 RepID=UPI001E3576D7|nr:hypothetical protein [[Clostridium] innocuum]MCC2836578.1 hypothetical protein [[Clostridium] innocuum]
MVKRIPVAKALEKCGYKKSYIAKKLNISPSYYCFFIKHPEKMSIKQAETVCALTGKKMGELDFDTNEDGFF